jgi:cardiolipin synthase A/B
MLNNPNVVSTVVLAAHWLIIAALSLRIVARRLPVAVSLAWLAVVFAVPFAGAAAYLALGGKRLGAERVARQSAAHRDAGPLLAALRASADAASPPAGTTGELLYRQALGLMDTPALGGNRTTLLEDYTEVFDALVRDIDAAEESVRLGFYIWHEGGRADDVREALRRARSRQVTCRVLVDTVGSKPFLEGNSIRSLRASGVEVVGALPPSLHRRRDLRYHRKIVVIDDRVAYMGSQNLADPRFFKQGAHVGPWVDAMLRIEGPAVTLLATIFETDWSVETGAVFAPPKAWRRSQAAAPADGVLVQVVPSGPAPYPDAIRQFLLTAVYSARRTLTLTTPYFVPDDAIVTALRSAAQGGVQVTLIVPARSDSFLVRYAGVSHFDDLMAAGVRIALFQGGLLHTKSLVVDGAVTLFGSVNLDMRSFWLNFENSLFVYGPAFAARIAELQQGYLTRSVLVDRDAWRRRPSRQHFLEDAARLVGPLL